MPETIGSHRDCQKICILSNYTPIIKTHSVFYESLLKKVAENLLESQVVPQKSTVIVEEEEEYELEEIPDSRRI